MRKSAAFDPPATKRVPVSGQSEFRSETFECPVSAGTQRAGEIPRIDLADECYFAKGSGQQAPSGPCTSIVVISLCRPAHPSSGGSNDLRHARRGSWLTRCFRAGRLYALAFTNYHLFVLRPLTPSPGTG